MGGECEGANKKSGKSEEKKKKNYEERGIKKERRMIRELRNTDK